MIDETNRYLFDLNGYLVLRGVLSAAELAEINEIVDANRTESTEAAPRTVWSALWRTDARSPRSASHRKAGTS